MYTIQNVYFIFPIICILFSLGKQTKLKIIILFLFLTIFIAFSKIGSDYLAYEKQYELIKQGENLKNIHGEILFKVLMKFFTTIGFDYVWFRVFFFGSLYSILSFLIYKMSINYSYSFFITYCTYLIYICSAYRQFIVMVLIILSCYLFEKKKKITVLILLILTLFFHISGIVGLVYFIFLTIKKNKLSLNNKKILLLSIIVFILNIVLHIFKNWIILIAEIFNRKDHLIYYLDFNRSLISVGLFSRLFVLIVFIIFIKTIKNNELYVQMFYLYLFGIYIYILIPSELMAGRFSNNARIVEIFLLPYIIFKGNLLEKIIKFIIFTIYLGVILYYQLKMQGGYYPYTNILI